MVMAAPVPKLLGQPIKRREDPRLITGTSQYVDDIQLPGMTHLVFVRSPYGHATPTACLRSGPSVSLLFGSHQCSFPLTEHCVFGLCGSPAAALTRRMSSTLTKRRTRCRLSHALSWATVMPSACAASSVVR